MRSGELAGGPDDVVSVHPGNPGSEESDLPVNQPIGQELGKAADRVSSEPTDVR
jgi:hypothetical protein